MPHRLAPTFRDRLAAADHVLVGAWICSGSPVVAEIMAGAGFDWLMIDREHAPNGLEAVQLQLQAIAPYPVTTMVRIEADDPVVIKRVLDLGAQNLLVPMVSTPEQAQQVARAAQYPPVGIRGVGSALARSGRWTHVENYLEEAARHVSVFVQIETVEAVENAAAIAAVEGIDGVLVGPSDLAATMGLLGQQDRPEVMAQVKRAFAGVLAAAKPVGVNAFNPQVARDYIAAGASFVLVGADVIALAGAATTLAATFSGGRPGASSAPER